MPNTPATWLDAVAVNATTDGTRTDPKVTVLTNGNILISWTAIGEDLGTGTVGLILDPLGHPVGEEFAINHDLGGQSSNVEIVAAPGGGFVAVFERQGGGYEEVYITRFDAAGEPSPSVRLFNDPNRDAEPGAFDPAIAIASPDSGLTIWRQVNAEGESVIRAYLFDPSASDPFQGVSSARFNLITEPDIQGEPAITALANGSYAVAVSAVIDGDSQIRLYIVDAEGNVSNARDAVRGAAGVEDLAPSLTVLGTRFVMTWSADGVVQVQLFSANGQTVGAQASIPGLILGDGERPVVQDLGDNTYAVVVMDSSTGTIQVQRFDVTGATKGALGIFHTGDASSPPDLALMPDGRLVVTFIDASGDVVMEILDTRDAPGEAGNTVTGTAGDDVIEYSGDAVFVGGGAGDDVITATAGPARTYDGGDGDDLLIAAAGAGPDTFIGGAGIDTLSYANASQRVYVDLLFNGADGGAEGDRFESIENLIGSAFDDILFGGNADNVIHGGDGNDGLLGDGGDDILHGEAGDDQLFGGEGNDTLFGGERDDLLEGGEGADILDGGDGFDIASYEEDDADLRVDLSTGFSSEGDTLISIEGVVGGEGDDELIGDDGDNRLLGSFGDDLIRGGAGADTLMGGAGIDTVSYAGSSAGVTINLSDNTASGGDAEGDVISEFENILGSSFDDTLTGDAGANVLDGGAGDDRMAGAAGDDTYYVDSRGDVVVEVEGGGIDTVLSSVSFDGRFTHVENITLTGTANANALGNDLDNVLRGNSGANILRGYGGDDTYYVDSLDDTVIETEGGGVDTVFSAVSFNAGSTHVENLRAWGDAAINLTGNGLNNNIVGNDAANLIDGGAGDDRMEGGGGDDTYVVDSRGDVVVEVEGGGIDTVLSSVSFDGRFTHVENITLTGTSNANALGNDLDNVLRGNSGANILRGYGGDDTYYVDSRDDVVIEAEGGGIDTVVSTVSFDARTTHVENITLTGSANINAIGNDLNNIIIGNSGVNILKGYGGDDTYYVDSRSDVVVEAADGGIDTVFSTVSFDARTTHVENLRAHGDAALNLIGNDLNNDIIGNDAANIIKGGGGDDRMEGRGGDDTYEVNSRGDVVIEVEGGGIDTVLSSVSFDARATHVENITLTGVANANAVANDLNNVITGNSASNIIIGYGGADIMTGGGGSDTFRYTSASDSTFADYDRIMDLGDDDFIDLRGVDADINVDGNQSFTQVDAFTGQAGQLTLIWLPSAGFTVLAMDVDGDGVADMRIVLYGDHADFDNFLGVGGG